MQSISAVNLACCVAGLLSQDKSIQSSAAMHNIEERACRDAVAIGAKPFGAEVAEAIAGSGLQIQSLGVALHLAATSPLHKLSAHSAVRNMDSPHGKPWPHDLPLLKRRMPR